MVQSAALCVAVIEGLTPAEYYLLGAARAALTPTIALTLDPAYAFDPVTPREYQPRQVTLGDADALVRTIEAEISTFEEDYLDLREEAQVRRYKEFRESILRSEGTYPHSDRERIVAHIQKAEFDMSKDKVQISNSNIVGPVNIRTRLEHVTQTVQQTRGWADEQRNELTKLLTELQTGLETVAEKRPDDADRVTRTAELVVAEATKAKPDKAFLSITAEGLKQAAQSVADIAPTVLAVAGKVIAFVAGLPS